MNDFSSEILNYVVNHVVSDDRPCGARSVRSHFQYVVGDDVIDRGLESLTAKPAKIYIRQGADGRYLIPTLEGWLRSDLQDRARRALMGTLLFLTGTDPGDFASSSYSWTNMAQAKRVVLNDHALVRSLIVASDLYNHACDPHALWTSNHENKLLPPVDLDAIAKVFGSKGLDGFLSYRRKHPQALVRLKQAWSQALTPDRIVAMRFIYSTFSRNGRWPTSRAVDSQLNKQGRARLTELLVDCPFFESTADSTGEERTLLRLAGLAHIEGAENDHRAVVELLVAATRMARENTEIASIHLADLAVGISYFAQDAHRLATFAGLVEAEPWISFVSKNGAARDFELCLQSLPFAFADSETLEDIVLAIHSAGPRASDAIARHPTDVPDEGLQAYGPVVRRKHDKFEILDSPRLYEEDFKRSVGVLGASVIYFDLDGFKAINTKFTEPVVDRTILPALQRLVMSLVEVRGFVYAEGGDEIVITLPNTSTDLAEAFTTVLLRKIEAAQFSIEGESVSVTGSAGIASSMSASDAQKCKEMASSAKQVAKDQGKNRCVLSALRT